MNLTAATPLRTSTCHALSNETCRSFPEHCFGCPGYDRESKPTCGQIDREFCLSTPCSECPADPLPNADLVGAPTDDGDDGAELEAESAVLMAQGAGLVSANSPLPEDAAARKAVPIMRGCLDYFPAALAYVAQVSRIGNEQHNPGEEMHHAREKSSDHADCAVRHLMDRGRLDTDKVRHTGKAAWRVLALLQQELEDAGLAPLARGARVQEVH